MASTLCSFKPALLILILLLAILAKSENTHDNRSTSSSLHPTKTQISSLQSICKSTPHPNLCFDSLKISISIGINPDILGLAYQSLQNAIAAAGKLSSLFDNSDLTETQKGTLQDCKQLHQISINSLNKAGIRSKSGKLTDVKILLSAALTNKNTCLEGLDSASGPSKQTLINTMITTYGYVSNSLHILSSAGSKPNGRQNRRLFGYSGDRKYEFPAWLSRKDRQLLQSTDYDPGSILTVALDGSGNFTSIMDAVNFAPNGSWDRIIIYVTQGVYQENVEIPSYKTNVVLFGDGIGATVITGNRSVGDGWTTYHSATVAVTGDGFLARDITFENTAGAEKHQAVALRVNSDLSAIYHCAINGYQDTLYVHSFRQFYRECNISGTVDFIFGNAAVVFQGCNLIARKPMLGQFNAITAQSRDDPNEPTGISIQNCSVIAGDDLSADPGVTNSYLGRPWQLYSRTVYIKSYIDNLIDPAGWMEWPTGLGLDTLYYGEYDNNGPGSATDNRVTWPGYHVMNLTDATNFTVSEFISSHDWLSYTSFPYDDGV